MSSLDELLLFSSAALCTIKRSSETRYGFIHSLFVQQGVSSRLIRKKGYPSIQKKLWGGSLWSPSYFAGSCGGAPISVLRQYIEAQRTPN